MKKKVRKKKKKEMIKKLEFEFKSAI